MHHDNNLVIISIPARLRKNLINHSLIAVQVVSTECLQKINIFNSVPNGDIHVKMLYNTS